MRTKERKERRERLTCLDDPQSAIAEAYRTVRTNIQFAGIRKELKSLLITSADPSEGKTTTAINLAIVMAQAGQRVLLVDADLRKPSLHQRLPVFNRAGLSNWLIRHVGLEDVVQNVWDVSQLDVITAGMIPPNPADLLSSKRMNDFLEQLSEQYDMVLVDSPPLLPVTDAQILARLVDGVLLVVGAGKVSAEHMKKAKNLLDHVGGHVIGAVLNNKKMDTKSYYS